MNICFMAALAVRPVQMSEQLRVPLSLPHINSYKHDTWNQLMCAWWNPI